MSLTESDRAAILAHAPSRDEVSDDTLAGIGQETAVFACVTTTGTAAAETAVCAAHRGGFTPQPDGGMGDITDLALRDCTGNDALTCQVCGAGPGRERDPADAEAWAVWDQARGVADRLDERQRVLLGELAARLITEQAHPDPAVRVLHEDDPLDDLIAAGLIDRSSWRLTDLGDTVHDGLTTGRWEP